MDLVEQDLAADALPYLAHALRLNPSQLAVQAYTLSLLSRRNWPLPIRVTRGDAEFESVRLSPDGKLIVTAARDGKAQIWDAATGEAKGAALVHRGVVTSAGFSRDGKRVVTASEDGTARIWSVETGGAISAPLEHREAVSWAGLTPDGTRVLTVSGDGAATLWDVATGRVLFQLPAGSGERHRCPVEPGRNTCGHRAAQWRGSNLESGNRCAGCGVVRSREGQENPRRSIQSGTGSVSSPHRPTIPHGSGTSSTARAIGAPIKHNGVVWDADFSPDGQLVVTASDDGTVGRLVRGDGTAPRRAPAPRERGVHDRVQPRRQAHRDDVGRLHRESVGCDDRAPGHRAHAARRLARCQLQRRRYARHDGVVGQDASHLGRAAVGKPGATDAARRARDVVALQSQGPLRADDFGRPHDESLGCRDPEPRSVRR